MEAPAVLLRVILEAGCTLSFICILRRINLLLLSGIERLPPTPPPRSLSPKLCHSSWTIPAPSSAHVFLWTHRQAACTQQSCEELRASCGGTLSITSRQWRGDKFVVHFWRNQVVANSRKVVGRSLDMSEPVAIWKLPCVTYRSILADARLTWQTSDSNPRPSHLRLWPATFFDRSKLLLNKSERKHTLWEKWRTYNA